MSQVECWCCAGVKLRLRARFGFHRHNLVRRGIADLISDTIQHPGTHMRLAVTGRLNSALFDSLLNQCERCIRGADHSLELDLSSADFAHPSGLVPFASLLRVLARQGVTVKVVKYPQTFTCSYYCRCNFFKRIGAKSPCADKNEGLGKDRAIPITELTSHKIDNDSLVALSRLLLRLPDDVEATEMSRKSFIDACGELASNTRHAVIQNEPELDNRPKGLLQAQFYRSEGRIELCVCDCGAGIKRSMEGEHREHFTSHLEAIGAALVFRNKNPMGDGEGVGLSAIHTYIKKNGGTLRIRSGDALRIQNGNRSMSVTEDLPVWNGTIVSIDILVEKNTDLSKIQERLTREAR
jgi:hypothetical protein